MLKKNDFQFLIFFLILFSDICVDVSQIEASQAHEMNLVAQKYGLLGADYFSFLTQDFEEAETLRQARKQEEEKAMYSVNIINRIININDKNRHITFILKNDSFNNR